MATSNNSEASLFDLEHLEDLMYQRTKTWTTFINSISEEQEEDCDVIELNQLSNSDISDEADEDELASMEEDEENENKDSENLGDSFSITLTTTEDDKKLMDLVNQTLPVINEHQRQMKEMGFDRVLDTFDMNQIEETVGNWLRRNNSLYIDDNAEKNYESRRESRQYKKSYTNRVHIEKEHDSDDSLQSGETARYIRSSRAGVVKNSCGTIIKSYRMRQRSREVLEEKYGRSKNEVVLMDDLMYRRKCAKERSVLRHHNPANLYSVRSHNKLEQHYMTPTHSTHTARRKVLRKRTSSNSFSAMESSSDSDGFDDYHTKYKMCCGQYKCDRYAALKSQKSLHSVPVKQYRQHGHIKLPMCSRSERVIFYVQTHNISMSSSSCSSPIDAKNRIKKPLKRLDNRFYKDQRPCKLESECRCCNEKKLCKKYKHLADTSTEDWFVENCYSPSNTVQQLMPLKAYAATNAVTSEIIMKEKKNINQIEMKEPPPTTTTKTHRKRKSYSSADKKTEQLSEADKKKIQMPTLDSQKSPRQTRNAKINTKADKILTKSAKTKPANRETKLAKKATNDLKNVTRENERANIVNDVSELIGAKTESKPVNTETNPVETKTKPAKKVKRAVKNVTTENDHENIVNESSEYDFQLQLELALKLSKEQFENDHKGKTKQTNDERDTNVIVKLPKTSHLNPSTQNRINDTISVSENTFFATIPVSNSTIVGQDTIKSSKSVEQNNQIVNRLTSVKQNSSSKALKKHGSDKSNKSSDITDDKDGQQVNQKSVSVNSVAMDKILKPKDKISKLSKSSDTSEISKSLSNHHDDVQSVQSITIEKKKDSCVLPTQTEANDSPDKTESDKENNDINAAKDVVIKNKIRKHSQDTTKYSSQHDDHIFAKPLSKPKKSSRKSNEKNDENSKHSNKKLQSKSVYSTDNKNNDTDAAKEVVMKTNNTTERMFVSEDNIRKHSQDATKSLLQSDDHIVAKSKPKKSSRKCNDTSVENSKHSKQKLQMKCDYGTDGENNDTKAVNDVLVKNNNTSEHNFVSENSIRKHLQDATEDSSQHADHIFAKPLSKLKKSSSKSNEKTVENSKHSNKNTRSKSDYGTENDKHSSKTIKKGEKKPIELKPTKQENLVVKKSELVGQINNLVTEKDTKKKSNYKINVSSSTTNNTPTKYVKRSKILNISSSSDEDDADCTVVSSTTNIDNLPQSETSSSSHVAASTSNLSYNQTSTSLNHTSKGIVIYTPQNASLAPADSFSNDGSVFNLTKEHLNAVIGAEAAEKFLKYYHGKLHFYANSTVYFIPPSSTSIDTSSDDSDDDVLSSFAKYGDLYAYFE